MAAGAEHCGMRRQIRPEFESASPFERRSYLHRWSHHATMPTIYPPYVIERSSRGERTLRHLLPAAHGPHHLPRHADQRRRREHHHRAAAVPRGGQSGARHPPLHQLAGRQRLGRAGDLRHDAVPQVAGEHDLHGHGGEHGRVPARGRPNGQALGAAALAHHDPPAVGRRRRARRRTSRSRRRRSCTSRRR